MTTIRQPLTARLFRPSSIAWLAAFRVLFGVAMAVSMARFLAYGWIDDFFVKPHFHFTYYGFGWVRPLSEAGMHGLFWALLALATAMAAGAFYRVTAPLFVVGFAYIQLIDVTTYLNHYYLAGLLALLLAVSPAHRAFSVDAWRARKRYAPLTDVPAIWHWAFRLQIGIVYTFAGLAKANADWLVHAQPLRIWLGSRSDIPILGGLFAYAGVPLAMSWAGFLFDSTIVWFLLARRTRLPAYGVVIVFHVLTRLLFPIGMFPVLMILGALVFFDADWPLALLRRVGLASREPVGVPSPARSPRAKTLGAALLVTYALVQIAIPLRFLAYGGNVRWDEQGMRFSWRVMVREKNGAVTFVVRNARTGRVFQVAPRAYLNGHQEREMASQPDLVLQLAHRIRDDVEARGDGPVSVFADNVVSLNGRRGAPMIDPTVDLAAIDDGLGRAAYVLPAPSEAPPHLRPQARLAGVRATDFSSRKEAAP